MAKFEPSFYDAFLSCGGNVEEIEKLKQDALRHMKGIVSAFNKLAVIKASQTPTDTPDGLSALEKPDADSNPK